MAQLIKRAEPGAVIKADEWNVVVDAVNELLQSGQTTGIKVVATLPAGNAADPIRIGQILQITGQNFGFSIGQTKVSFEGPFGSPVIVLRANLLTGSSDERLLLMMPPIPTITAAGMTLTMRVDNGVASDRRTVFAMPVVIPLTGDIFVNWRADVIPNPNPNPLQVSPAPQSASFNYRLQTGINMPATFDLSADVIDATVPVPAGLVASIEFRDEANNVITNKQVEMGKNDTRNILVRIPNLPASFASQSFTLKVTASSSGVVGSDSRSFTVGTAITPADPKIDAQQTGAVVLDVATGNVDTNPLNGTLEGSLIKLRTGKQIVIMFNVKLLQAGTYDVTIQPKAGTPLTGWAPQLMNTLASIPVASDNDQTSRLMQFAVSPSSTATATGTIVFRIKRQGAPSDFTKEFGAQLLT
jgi:hypothetical protein